MAMGRMLRRIKGFLNNEDMEMLEEASRRKLKYPKMFVASWLCGTCNYKWFYQTLRCPSCSSGTIARVK